MRRIFGVYIVLFLGAVFQANPVLGQFGKFGGGIIIGRVEGHIESEWGGSTTNLNGIEVDIVREEATIGEVVEERTGVRTSSTGVFMVPVDSLEGTFRIARIKFPEAEEWIDVERVNINGDVSLYGAAAFHRYARVVAINPLIYEKSSDGRQRFVMLVGPFSDICLDILGAFPLSPWKDAIEQARELSLNEGVELVEEDEPVQTGGVDKAVPGEAAVTEKITTKFSRSESEEEDEQGSRGVVSTVIITSIVMVVLAVLVGMGGRKRHRPKEREIDITEIELIEAEREKQASEAVEGEGEKEELADPTTILLEKEGWFLREFRRARVRIHWKKYDSAAVSLEKTTRFMEEHIDWLKDKKEVYTLVLHYSYLGRCYLESGRRNDALKVFKRGIELNEYNSRMCEMGLADTLDAIARSEESPTVESLGAKYPILMGGELEAIMIMSQQAEPKA